MRILIFLAAVLGLVSEAFANDVLARRTLRIGTIVAADDLSVESAADARVGRLLVGLEVRRVIFAGQPVRRSDLGPPTLVRRNQVVVMVFRSGGLGLRAEGRALAAGGAGEMVEVMNMTSRLTVRAVVTGRGRVEVRR